jgi:signal transduction histidine kinase
MLQHFLEQNRAQLIERCRSKVALMRASRPDASELDQGIPLFLSQLVDTLRARKVADGPPAGSEARNGPRDLPGEIASSATKHGYEMLLRGFSIEEVVREYGDLCQAITGLAAESRVQFSSDEFNILNRCLDVAIADAVSEFQRQRERRTSTDERRAETERLGSLMHELRGFLGTATLAFAALKSGAIGPAGATSAVLERSLGGMREMIDRTFAQVRLDAGTAPRLERIELRRFIADVHVAASLSAHSYRCSLEVCAVDGGLEVEADAQLLHSAVSNLLNNAFKFTRPHGHVQLRAHGVGERVLIEVRDECGGLPEGKAEHLFASFNQQGADRSGLGLGLSIARRAAETMGGSVRASDVPGTGCVFTIDLPRPFEAIALDHAAEVAHARP